MKCPTLGCVGALVAQSSPIYYFKESGLPNVIVQCGEGLQVFTCAGCGDDEVRIRSLDRLNQAIADEIACSPYPLSESEHRFLTAVAGDGPLTDLIERAQQLSLSNHVPWMASALLRLLATIGPEALHLSLLVGQQADPAEIKEQEASTLAHPTVTQAGFRLLRLLPILPIIQLGTRTAADAMLVASYADTTWTVKRAPMGDAFLF